MALWPEALKVRLFISASFPHPRNGRKGQDRRRSARTVEAHLFEEVLRAGKAGQGHVLQVHLAEEEGPHFMMDGGPGRAARRRGGLP